MDTSRAIPYRSSLSDTINRLLKIPSSCVLSRMPPCDMPQGYASAVPLPAALLEKILNRLGSRCPIYKVALRLLQFAAQISNAPKSADREWSKSTAATAA